MREKHEAGHRVKTGASGHLEQFTQNFAGLSQNAIIKNRAVCGSFRPHIERPGASGDLRHKTGGGLNRAGSADGDEHGAFAERFKNALPMERCFAKPADVRTNQRAARAAR